jgi:hypothetical protein
MEDDFPEAEGAGRKTYFTKNGFPARIIHEELSILSF